MDEIHSDLYVSSTGDNNNDGLSPLTPLRNIWHAMYRINAGENGSQRNIFVEEGEYYFSINDHFFPIAGKKNVNLIGEGSDKVIINMDSEHYLCFYINNINSLNGKLHLEGFHIKNIFSRDIVIDCTRQSVFILKDLKIDNLRSDNYNGGDPVGLVHIDHIVVEDVSISSSEVEHYAMLLGGSDLFVNRLIMDSVVIKGNGYWYAMGGLNCLPKKLSPPTKAIYKIYNLQSTRSEACNMNSGEPIMPTSLSAQGDSTKVFLINATIGDNNSMWGPAVSIRDGATLQLYNSIIYGDTPYSIMLSNESGTPPSSAIIDYNLIKLGEQSSLAP